MCERPVFSAIRGPVDAGLRSRSARQDYRALGIERVVVPEVEIGRFRNGSSSPVRAAVGRSQHRALRPARPRDFPTYRADAAQGSVDGGSLSNPGRNCGGEENDGAHETRVTGAAACATNLHRPTQIAPLQVRHTGGRGFGLGFICGFSRTAR